MGWLSLTYGLLALLVLPASNAFRSQDRLNVQLTVDTNISFIPSHQDFLGLFNFEVGPRLLAQSQHQLYHEACIWMPNFDAWLVTSNLFNASCKCVDQAVLVSLVNFRGGSTLLPELSHVVLMANGGTTDFKGGIYLLSQGLGTVSGGIFHVDSTLKHARAVPNNGQVLNSPNDIVVDPKTGALFFTDPSYAIEAQGFRYTHRNGTSLLRTHGGGRFVDVDSGFEQPNGVVFSPDFSALYVSNVWKSEWHLPHSSEGDVHIAHDKRLTTNQCYVDRYDAIRSADGTLEIYNRQRFFELDCDADGYPDGLKVDEMGNVYAGIAKGVIVHNSEGVRLGTVEFTNELGVANLAFGGRDGRTLLALNEKYAIALQLHVAGVLGPYGQHC